MLYRKGGSSTRINTQYDEVYADFIDGATGWLAINKGDWIAVNVCRASIIFDNPATSVVLKATTAPEVQMLLELKMFGGDVDGAAYPIDQWQNTVVATGLRGHRSGWVRLRILNINNIDGTGVAMALQISRTGDSGAAT